MADGKVVIDITADDKDVKKKLGDVDDAAQDAAGGMEDLSDSTEKSEKSFGIAEAAIGNFIANGLTALVSKIGETLSSIAGLSEETREYREDMAKLETAFTTAGHSTEAANKIYEDFYAIIGESDRSVEAANHLAELTSNTEELADWQTIAAGVTAKFGDSLPLEGLTEAANETAKVGKTTGVLADALNWASADSDTFKKALGGNNKALTAFNKAIEAGLPVEDAFTEALGKMSTEQERSTAITKTLNGLYTDAADEYNSLTKETQKARRATADMEKAQAELGKEIEPVTTYATELKTEFLRGLTPAIKNNVLPQIKNFMASLKERGTITSFTNGISNLARVVLPPLANVVQFCAAHIETLAGVVFTAVTAFTSFSAAMKISAAVNAVTTAISGLSAGVSTATKAQAAWNAVMSANPIGAVLTAVGLLTAGIALLVSANKEAKESTDLLSESQRESVTAAKEAADAFKERREATDELAKSQMANVDYVRNNLLPQLETLVDENGRVLDGEKGRAQFILGQLNEALGTEYTSLNQIVDANGKIKDSIYEVIDAKKAQMLLETYNEEYMLAIDEVTEAERRRAIQAQELAAQEKVYNDAYKEYKEAQAEFSKKAADAHTEGDWRKLGSEANYVEGLRLSSEKQKEILEEKQKEYDDAEGDLKLYYETIDNFIIASTLLQEGETEKALSYLTRLSSGFITAEKARAEAAKQGKSTQEEQTEYAKKQLEQQVIDAEVNLRLLEDEYKKTQENMTAEQKKQAEQRIKDAKKVAEDAKQEYYNVGGNITKGIAEGAESEGWILTGAMDGLIDKAVSAAKKALDSHSPSKRFEKEVGVTMPQGIGVGWEKDIPNVEKQITGDISELTARVQSTVSAENTRMAQGTAERNTGMYDVARAIGTQTAGINSLAGEYRRGCQNTRPVIIELNGRELGRAVVDVGNEELTRVGAELALSY
ncbi:MAG: hypothetical protein J6K66_00995 [Clostridia bacterium]|nr:hypothetical protein [Clostridia bacterium]